MGGVPLPSSARGAQALSTQALLNMAAETGLGLSQPPATREAWAQLARALDIKVIHIAGETPGRGGAVPSGGFSSCPSICPPALGPRCPRDILL